MKLAAAGTVFAVCALLGAEWRRWRLGVWLCKPLASLGFVAVAWLGGALASPHGRFFLLGLALCACGDVLLIPSSGKSFLLGLGSFALGHVAYTCGFVALGRALGASTIAAVLMAVVVIATLRWLGPHAPSDMRVPIRIYMLVIAIMIAAAVGASVTHDVRLGLGALAFAASDLSVARERFVRASFVNLLWGLPLYYAAQLVLAFASAD
jgi:uncharacterized membrane protein YhhN